MTNVCVRCERPSADGLTTILNPYHNGPETIAVCERCLRLGDRIAGPLEIEFDEDDAQTAALQEYRDSNRPAGDTRSGQARAAAERLLDDTYRLGIDDQRAQDIQTVASYALEAGPEVARLQAALEWYANKSNYDLDELYSDDPRLRAKGVTYRSRPILEDEGERARAALSTPGAPES